MAKYIDLTTATNAILVSPDPTGATQVVVLNKANIKKIAGVYTSKPTNPNIQVFPNTADIDSNMWIYPYPTKTIINIVMVDDDREQIELQDVVTFVGGTAGWAAGTQAALDQAIADIYAIL